MPTLYRSWRLPNLPELRTAILSRRWAGFAVLGLALFAFGVGTLNLFMLLRAKATLIAERGWQAAMDGGLHQLAELLLTGYASMAANLIAKVCEDSLVRQLGDELAPSTAGPASEARSAGCSGS